MTLDEYYEKVKEEISQIKKDYYCILPKNEKIKCVKEMIEAIDLGSKVFVCMRTMWSSQEILDIIVNDYDKEIRVPKRSFVLPNFDYPELQEQYLSAVIGTEEYDNLIKEERKEGDPLKAIVLINDIDSILSLALGLPEFLDYFPKMLWYDGGWFRSMEDRRKALVETLMKLENHD